jgi:serine/threonine protein kinase
MRPVRDLLATATSPNHAALLPHISIAGTRQSGTDMIGRVVSHYRILAALGEGGMGSVYVAEDVHLGRRVAIKFPMTKLDEHYRARFLREARAASLLNHPNIASVYDYGETSDGQPFIVMELINGQTLSSMIDHGQLSLSRAVEIMENVARALGEAHEHGVIHRDIKPSNVIINNRGEVKVLDFGLAKHLNGETLQDTDPNAKTLKATRTQSGAVVGTPLYLSPEQALGESVDARSDLFAAGTVLYESIAGKPPFSGKGMIEIAAQVIYLNPPPPSSLNPRVPPELDRISLKALAKKPDKRYQSANELILDLQSVRRSLAELGEDQTPTRRIPVSHRTGATSAMATLSDIFSRPRLSIGIFALSIAVFATSAWALWSLWRSKPHQPNAEAQKWYDIGTNDLREGAYFKAIKPLEQAIAADDKFALAHARLSEAWTELDYTDRAQLEFLRVDGLTPDRTVLKPLDALYLDAIRATITRDFAGAIMSYKEIVRLKPEEAEAYLDLGRAYEKNDQIDLAIEQYGAATKRDVRYAAAFLRTGILYGRKRDLNSASIAFDKAETLFKALSNIEGRTEVLYQRGSLLSRIGKLNEARDHLQKALEMTQTTDNTYQKIKTMLQLSSVFYSQGGTEQAKAFASDAINLAQTSRLENLTTQGLIDLGNTYLVGHEYGEAEKYFKQALEIAQRNNGRRNEAMALLSLGRLLIQQEIDPDEGLNKAQQALKYFQQGGYNTEVSEAILLRGRVKLLKGDYSGALRDFDEQLQLSKKLGDPSQLAKSYLLLGNLLSDQERYSEALENFEKSYEIYKELVIPLNVGYCLLGRSDMLWRFGRYAEARELLNQVPAVAAQIDSNYKQVLLARSYLVNAKLALSEGRLAEAKSKAEQVLALVGSQSKHTAVEAKSTLAMIQALSRAKRESLRTSEEAVELAKQVNDQYLLSKTLLASAAASLESDDAEKTRSMAREVQQRFARDNQQDSEWQAWLLLAQASVRLNDLQAAREQVDHVNALLVSLQQKWGTGAFNGYLQRPDIQRLRKQQEEVLASTR